MAVAVSVSAAFIDCAFVLCLVKSRAIPEWGSYCKRTCTCAGVHIIYLYQQGIFKKIYVFILLGRYIEGGREYLGEGVIVPWREG